MLIGNYNVFSKSCGRFTSGSSLSDDRGSWGKNGSVRGRYWGWVSNTINQLTSIPDGYKSGYAWILPNQSGGMASRVNIVGSGYVMGGNLAGGLGAAADLTGTGDITSALLGLIVSAVADLTGSATLAGDIAGIISLAASVTGGAAVAAAIIAKAEVTATLIGDGSLAGDIWASGDMSTDITVTGDVLSTANVGDAVWGKLLEAGFSASQIIRIVAAAVAGSSSGGPDSPVFRNLSDTKDQISGSADSDGNRTDVTYGD